MAKSGKEEQDRTELGKRAAKALKNEAADSPRKVIRMRLRIRYAEEQKKKGK